MFHVQRKLVYLLEAVEVEVELLSQLLNVLGEVMEVELLAVLMVLVLF